MNDESGVMNAVVTAVYPNKVQIEIADIESFKVAGEKLSVGSYLRISDSDDCAIIAVIQNFSIQKREEDSDRRYLVEGVPIGFLDSEGQFSRGGGNIAIPPVGVRPAAAEDIQKIYDRIDMKKMFTFSSLSQDQKIRVPVDGDRFFNKHIAVVGSTGCGKSCSMAAVLQKAIKARETGFEGLNNSHIVVFDLHGEYRSAFPSANHLDISNLSLPYWLMNGEELEELLVETGEFQAYNQSSLLRRLVTRNKQVKSGRTKVLFDSPVRFSLQEGVIIKSCV